MNLQRGIYPPGTFELTGGALVSGLLRTPRGSDWRRTAKHVGFIPEFVTDVDAMLAKHAEVSGVLEPR
jgi:hypothetical protein